MPAESRNIALGERFGKTPLEIEEGDADRWLVYIQAMSIEGEVRALTADMASDEELVRDGDA